MENYTFGSRRITVEVIEDSSTETFTMVVVGMVVGIFCFLYFGMDMLAGYAKHGTHVDILTPNDLPQKFRAEVLASARPLLTQIGCPTISII